MTTTMYGHFKLSHELDQMMVQYRQHLERIGPLWAQASELRLCHGSTVSARTADDMLRRLELAVTGLMEKTVQVEQARQDVLDLKAALDISKQTVDAKSKHLGQEEKQKEEEQGLRFKEFKRIHRFQDEKVTLEKEMVPAKRRLAQIMDVLDEKNEKMRNLENFHETLYDHCEKGMTSLREQTDAARAERAKWDKLDLDIGKEVREFALTDAQLTSIEQNVRELSNVIQHHKQWYEEEMQTKLFYSTRNKEIKQKLSYYKSLLRRMETSGRSDDIDEDADGRRMSRRSENILVDGSPGVHAKEVEHYLSRQFGMRVLADYTMLKRLKDEIGVQGLAYLVEKVRLQGPSASVGTHTSGPAIVDWEEQRVEQALKGIALEYRDSEEGRRMLRPGASITSSHACSSPAPSTLPPCSPSSANMAANSQPLGGAQRPPSTAHSPPLSMTSPSSQGSSSSLRRKSSLARIRKLFKF